MKLPNFGYHLARLRGRIGRSFYSVFLPLIVRRPISVTRDVDFDVFAYSSESTLPEQVRSIRSFLRFAGRPRKFVVVSDGSHSPASIRLLKKIDPVVEFRSPKSDSGSGPLAEYLDRHPTGKQLKLIMNLPEERPSLYVDSDVLFFPAASSLTEFESDSAPAWYLADCRFSGDERLLQSEAEGAQPVNTGVLVLHRPLDWSLSLERLAALPGLPNFFTNQTMTHLTMHQNGARPLDPARFVLQLDDQFEWADRYAGPQLVLRHYVNPIRHKFWAKW